MNPDEHVLELDLAKLSQEDLDWLHDLRNKMHRINIAMYVKGLLHEND